MPQAELLNHALSGDPGRLTAFAASPRRSIWSMTRIGTEPNVTSDLPDVRPLP